MATTGGGTTGSTADVIVLGLGAMGGAALHHLAARGARVLGIERFAVGHDRGSSHGETRIIRKAYFEHPDYVPLLERAYGLWAALETATGERLFDRTGLLLVGAPDGEVVAGVRRARARHGLAVADVPAADWAGRFGAFRCGEGMVGLFEADAGQLRVEACVRAHVAQARTLGARVVTGARVTGWSAEGGGVAVQTADGEVYRAGALVIAAGAWSAGVLADVGLPLVVRRRVQLWVGAGSAGTGGGGARDGAGDAAGLDTGGPGGGGDAWDGGPLSLAGGCPVFAYDLLEGFFYGFPARGGRMKVACHWGGAGEGDGDGGGDGGDDVAAAGGGIDPDALDRSLRAADVAPVARFLARWVPGAGREVLAHSACMYTMTPDGHFVIDRHPRHANVCFAAGFSGHGFKFAPLVGSVLADLALEGRTGEAVGFLGVRRWGVRLARDNA